MKRIQIVGILMVAVMTSVLVAGAANASTGTVRPYWNTYSEAPMHYGYGPESDFLRLGAKGEGGNQVDVCEDGQVVDLYFYVHNSTPAEANGDPVKLDGPGVSRRTKVKLDVPTTQASNSHTLVATISSDNSDVVTDTVTINCPGKQITLQYLEDSVNMGTSAEDHSTLGEFEMVGNLSVGATLGYEGGLVPGCWEYRARIGAQVMVSVFDVPVDPEIPDEPEETDVPDEPEETPRTGIASTSLTLAALGSIVGGVCHQAVVARRARQ